MRGLLQRALLGTALVMGGAAAAPEALAVSWNNYVLGEFYDISQATDPEVRAAGRAVVFFGNATGFVISPEGHILTNYHVYDSFGDVGTVYLEYTSQGYTRALRVQAVVARRDADMAIYKATVTNLPYLKIDTASPRVGMDCFIVGHPNSRSQEVSYGKVLATGHVLPGGPTVPSVEYSAQTWWGSSGSPIINRAGNVFALHWGWDANGVSTGRLAGVPFDQMARVVPEFAAIAARYGVGAGATAGTTGGGSGGATTGSTSGGGSTTGGATTGGATYVYPGLPSLSNGRPLVRLRGGSSSGGSRGGSTSLPVLPVGGSVSGTVAAGARAVYRCDVAARGDLTIDLQGPSGADLDLAVWKWDFGANRGNNVGTADGMTSTERVVVRDASPGSYIVVVLAYAGSGNFRLSADLSQQTSVGGAVATATGTLTGVNDWKLYQFDVTQGGGVTVTLSGPSGTDFDLYVFRGLRVDANQVVAYDESPDSQEAVTFTASPGSYSILVRSAGGAGRFDLAIR